MSVFLVRALSFLKRFWPYILVALIAWYLFDKAESWCNGACKDAKVAEAVQHDRADTAEQKLAELDRARIKQQEEWASATAAEEVRARRDAESRAATFSAIRKRVVVDPVVNSAVLPPVLAGLSVESFAAAEPTESPAGAAKAPAADSAAAWIVDLGEWTAECRDRVTAWERFYQSLRSAQ